MKRDVRGRAPRTGGRPRGAAGLRDNLLPWLVSALVFVVLSRLSTVFFSRLGPDDGAGLVGLVFSVTIPLVSGFAGTAVARRSVRARGPLAWLVAGVPGPVVFALVNVLRSVMSDASRGGILVPVAMAVVLVAAALGSLLAGRLLTMSTPTGRGA